MDPAKKEKNLKNLKSIKTATKFNNKAFNTEMFHQYCNSGKKNLSNLW